MLLKEYPLEELAKGYSGLFGAGFQVFDQNREPLFTVMGEGQEETWPSENRTLYQEGRVVGFFQTAAPSQEKLEQASGAFAIGAGAMLDCKRQKPNLSPNEDWAPALMEALLDGQKGKEEILALARQAELDESRLRATVCVELDFEINRYFNINLNLGYVSLRENLRTELLEKLRRNQYLNAQDFFAYYGDNHLVLSKSFFPETDSARIYLALDKICQSIQADLMAFPLMDAHIAYGNLYAGLEQVGQSYAEATEILSLGKIQHPEVHFYTIHNILIDNICHFLHPQIISKILLPTLAKLNREGGKDLESLLRCGEVFVDCCMDCTAAAARLYMHRNTLRTKLSKLEELTGLNFTQDFSNSLILKLLAVYARQNHIFSASSQTGGEPDV